MYETDDWIRGPQEVILIPWKLQQDAANYIG